MDNIIITGASKGIGSAILKKLMLEFKGDQYRFIAMSRTESALYKDLRVRWLQTDLSHGAHLSAVRLYLEQYVGHIKLLVNNVGIMPLGIEFLEASRTHYDQVMHTNLWSCFYMCQCCIPHMSEGSKIVNIASVSGTRAEKDIHIVPYGISKAGVIMLTKYLANIYPGLQINAISPGFIRDTELVPGETPQELIDRIPQKREGFPDEVAEMVRYLSKADYVTGQNFIIDGGLVI